MHWETCVPHGLQVADTIIARRSPDFKVDLVDKHDPSLRASFEDVMDLTIDQIEDRFGEPYTPIPWGFRVGLGDDAAPPSDIS